MAGHQNREPATARKLAGKFRRAGEFWQVGEFSRRFGFDFDPLPENPRNSIEIRSCALFFFGSPKAEGKTPNILKTGCRPVRVRGLEKRENADFGVFFAPILKRDKIPEIPLKYALAPSFFISPIAEKATPILF